MAYVTGAGMVKIDRHYSLGVRELAAQAAEKALEDSERSSVDFVIAASSLSFMQEPQLDLASYLASTLGLRGVKALTVEAGEASGAAAVQAALALVKSGLARRVLVVGVDKMTDYNSPETYRHLQHLYDTVGEGFHKIGHAGIAGILMRLYMTEYGVDREVMAYWSALMHANAKENPYAMLRFALDPSKVKNAMPLADPVTLLDAYPLGDGAAAIVIESSPGRAMASILTVESATGYPSVAHRQNPLHIESLAEAASKAGIMGGDGRMRIDFMEIHDSFTITAFMILETLGASDKGKAAEDAAEGRYSRDGELPVNPSGGLKARGHPIGATGFYQYAEAAMQLAGVFPGVKVGDAKRGAVVSLNGFGSSSYVGLLSRP